MDGLLENFGLMTVPDEIFERILTYLSYDSISVIRSVCRKFNRIAMAILNAGFAKSERQTIATVEWLTEEMPRRESERRSHALATHAAIISSVETRIMLLRNTYKEFVVRGQCCFVAGKVIDELLKIVRMVRFMPRDTTTTSHAHVYFVLREFRDLSSMAMEHFDRRVAPAFKREKNETSIWPLFGNDRIVAAKPIGIYGGGVEYETYTSTHTLRARALNSGSSLTDNIIATRSQERLQQGELNDCRAKIIRLQMQMIQQNQQILKQNRRLELFVQRVTTLETKKRPFDDDDD
jgi:F-box domain